MKSKKTTCLPAQWQDTHFLIALSTTGDIEVKQVGGAIGREIQGLSKKLAI